MPTARQQRLMDITKILAEEHTEGYLNGIAEGHQVAERILVWFLENPKAKEPHSIETLERWARTALAELRSKLNR